MRNKVWPAVGWLLIAGLSLGADLQENAKAGESPAGDSAPLIRLDLLRAIPREMKPPRRNIFAPSSNAAAQETAYREGDEEEIRAGSAETKTEESGETREDQPAAFSLRYIGYVRSPGKIVALILLDGLAMAVEEGEGIAEGLHVSHINTERIDIVDASSQTRTFPREGDEK